MDFRGCILQAMVDHIKNTVLSYGGNKMLEYDLYVHISNKYDLIYDTRAIENFQLFPLHAELHANIYTNLKTIVHRSH